MVDSNAGPEGTSTNLQATESLLNSPADPVVEQRPSWWTFRNAYTVLGGMALGAAGSMVWIAALRRRMDERTRELLVEIESRKHTEVSLKEKTKELEAEIRERIRLHSELQDKKNRLEKEIEERKRMEREVEQTHRQLIGASRQAGQAEVASSVLHNVGNVLNSVNVSATVIADRLRALRLANLDKVARLLHTRAPGLGNLLPANDPLLRLPAYLEELSNHLGRQQTDMLAEVKDLALNLDHIKEIVAMQQDYAKVSGLLEPTNVVLLAESAIKMHLAAFTRHSVRLVREYQEVPRATLDRHKVLQILVNLLHNAKYACEEARSPDKQVTVRIRPQDEKHICIEVVDNGVGIAPENMSRLFGHGFTTRKEGHGFGLHSAALAAREMGGDLTAHSDGRGRGATFTLEIPLEPPRDLISAGLSRKSAGLD